MLQASSGCVNSNPRSMRRALRLGTCLSGTAAALFLLMPTAVNATDACGAPVDGVVTCPVSDVGFPDGIDYIIDPAMREDLTVNLGDGLTIDTNGTDNNGIHVGNLNGAVTINAAGTFITTSGVGATAMSGVTYVGDLTMHAGDIATSGYQSHGIVGSASQGDVTITAGSVSTTGDLSYGISVLADAPGGGHVAIDVDTVSTAGIDSKGIEVFALAGDVAISARSVSTTGDYATAIEAIAGGNLSIAADTVSTTGYLSHGVVGVSLGGSLSVEANSVSTNGDGSVGIYAISIVQSGGGNDNSFGTYDHAVTPGHDLVVNAGTVITRGNYAPAIVAINETAGGQTIVIAESVLTTGFASKGIQAVSVSGDATVSAGSVMTLGHLSGAIDVNAGGKATVTVGDIYTAGYGSTGVRATGGSAEVTLTGAITTGYDASRAIIARAYNGDAAVHNLGAITTHGYVSNGIYAGATGNVKIDGGGTVATYGDRATAIVGFSSGGSVSISTGAIATTGDRAGGVYAGIRDIYGTGFAGDITIDTDAISTRGSGFQAAGILAVNYSTGGNITINAGGPVTTRLESAGGIVAFGLDGVTTVNAGDVSTRGSRADAILAYGGSVVIDATGSVSSIGDESNAIKGVGSYGDVTIKVRDVTTSGDFSSGIQALARNNASVVAGAVATQGDGAAGIVANAGGVDANVATHAGAASVKATSITTSGAGSTAVFSNSFLGDNNIDIGTAATKGDYAYGIAAIALYGNLQIKAGTISTEGKLADGIGFLAHDGELDLAVGTISTKGDQSMGIRGFTVGHDSKITVTGGIETQGIRSRGIFVTTIANSLVIENQGTIVTKGASAQGIRVNALDAHTEIRGGTVVTAGDEAIGIDFFGVGDVKKSADVSAVSVTTSGAKAHGIQILNPDDGFIGNRLPVAGLGALSAKDIKLTVKTVKVSGAGAAGILIEGMGKVTVDAGATSSATTSAIVVKAREEALLTVRGTTVGAGDAIVLTGQDVTMNVAEGGSIMGSNGVVLSAIGPYVPPADGTVIGFAAVPIPTATLTNAGTIVGGSGYAVLVSNGVANIANSGRIDGAVKLGVNDDLITNSGIFNVTKDSDFGAGTDLLTNIGTVRLAGAKASFFGLEKFDNKGGLVDLTNGRADDVFTLDGNYVGSGNARLALDLKGATADNFVVTGAATGTTKVLLTHLSGADATLTGGKSIALIKVGAGSVAGAFTLASSNVGFIQYGLDYNAASGTYGLIGTAGSAVYRGLKVSEGAAAAWHQSGDVWSAHMAGLRDSVAAGGETGKRLWGQAYGQVDSRDEVRDIAGAAQGHDLGYKQNHVGGQIGYELGQRGKVAFGVTAGYVKSTLDYSGADEKLEYGVANLGGYAGYKAGILFASALVKYDRFRVSADSDTVGYSDKFAGSGYGAQLEAGARFGSVALFAEPVASLAWHKTNLGDLKALGQSIEFDTATGLRGKIGAKVGGSHKLASGSSLIFYGGANLVHEFAGEDGVTLVSGGTSEHVSNAAIKTYGQGLLGLSLRSAGRVSGFIEGNANFGGDYKGSGGRVGLSIKL